MIGQGFTSLAGHDPLALNREVAIMPYYTHTLTPCPVDARHPIGVAVSTTEHATLAVADAFPGTTGAIFSDEITIGRTVIRNERGEWVNDYANPARTPGA